MNTSHYRLGRALHAAVPVSTDYVEYHFGKVTEFRFIEMYIDGCKR